MPRRLKRFIHVAGNVGSTPQLVAQAKFDRFVAEYNHERPHQALGMRYPAELYTPSARRYEGLPPLEYPLHDATITVTQCGRLCFGGRKINLSVVFAGQRTSACAKSPTTSGSSATCTTTSASSTTRSAE